MKTSKEGYSDQVLELCSGVKRKVLSHDPLKTHFKIGFRGHAQFTPPVVNRRRCGDITVYSTYVMCTVTAIQNWFPYELPSLKTKNPPNNTWVPIQHKRLLHFSHTVYLQRHHPTMLVNNAQSLEINLFHWLNPSTLPPSF